MASRAAAGPPFVTDDPVPVDLHGWEINSAVSVISVQGRTAAALPGIDINYGVLPGIQLHVQPQIAAVWSGSGSKAGFGDTQAGAKIRLLDEDRQGWAPMVSIYPIGRTSRQPTGSQPTSPSKSHFRPMVSSGY